MNFFVLTCLVAVVCQASQSSPCDVKGRLVRNLQKGYEAIVEPKNCTIKFSVAVNCARYDPEESELTTNVWERYWWIDTRLAWDPKDYEGIDVIRIPAHYVWLPDIRLYNSVKAAEERSHVNVVLKSDGTVLWIPIAVYKTLCANAVGNSSMTCLLKLGSWTYDAFIMDLQPADQGPVDIDNYNVGACPLQVVKFTGKVNRQLYACCKEPYSSLDINLTLKPKASK